jgi:hypothetical protein
MSWSETDDSPWRESVEPVEPTLEEEFAGRMDAADRAARLEDAISRRHQPDGGEEAWHEFHDGPWAGQRVQIETSPDAYGHLVPRRAEVGVGEWVPADALPNVGRYVRTGSYGETVAMTWYPAVRTA